MAVRCQRSPTLTNGGMAWSNRVSGASALARPVAVLVRYQLTANLKIQVRSRHVRGFMGFPS
jgi:hypothetical protein